MWHCTRMGCCNKQRAAGARIAGLPQPSLRQRLSVFFGERLDFSAGIWIIAINTAFRRWFCGSGGGCPRNRHREMASIKPFPKTAIPPYPPYGMQKPPTEFPMPTTASGICMQTLDTCPAHMLLLPTPSHQASRHQTSGILWKPHYAQAAIFVGHGPCPIPSPVAI